MMKSKYLKRFLCIGLCLLVLLGSLASCKAKNDAEMAPGEMMDSITESSKGEAGASGKPSLGEVSDSLEGQEKEDPVKIIRTVNLYAETQRFDEAVAQIQATVSELGGYVGSSTVQGSGLNPRSGRSRYAEYTLRIPAERLDAFLSTVGNTLHVTSTESTAEDVTNEYYDMEARLSVLEAERQVLEKMLSETTSVSNMISLEERLYDVISEIESYRSALRVYDNKVSYSTVTLHLSEVLELTVVEESFGSRVKKALRESWDNLVEGAQDFLITMIYALPVLLVLAIVVGVILGVVFGCLRKSRRKKKEKKIKDEV